MPSLYDIGWRQGTVFGAELAASVYVYVDGALAQRAESFKSWVVVSQDCDLTAASSDHDEPRVEIMPVHDGSPGGPGWGIRSRILRLAAEIFVDADDPKLKIAPAALCVYNGEMQSPLAENRTRALKTWLGLRYDRPAVPEQVVEFARSLATAVESALSSPPLGDACLDVLFQIVDETAAPFEYVLYAVVTDEADVGAIERWLTDASLKVPAELGFLGSPVEALTKSQITLDILENTYAASLSQITWKKEKPKP